MNRYYCGGERFLNIRNRIINVSRFTVSEEVRGSNLVVYRFKGISRCLSMRLEGLWLVWIPPARRCLAGNLDEAN